jgi:uncharacterized peroxidase-related enzyme
MARISFVEPGQASPRMRAAYAASEKVFGHVLDFYKVMAHAPDMVDGFNFLYDKLHHLDLDPKLRELAYLMVSKTNGCEYCVQVHTILGRKEGLTEAQLSELSLYKDSAAYDTVQKLVLRYAEELTRTAHTDAAVMEGLKQFLTEKEVVELAMTVSIANMANRFTESLDITPPK